MAKVVLPRVAQLGEGAIWNWKTSTLLWIDIVEGRLFEYNPANGRNRSCHIRQAIGTVVPCATGNQCVVGLSKGVALFDMDSGKVAKWLVNLEPELEKSGNRCNDGKCDPQGRLWVGTMDSFCTGKVGALYSVTEDGTSTLKVPNAQIPNGIAWSKDGKTMYWTDTPTHEIYAWDFDGATGEISNKRVVVTIDPKVGHPDGFTIDADDNLWICLWGGSSVVCYRPVTNDAGPAGELLKTIPIPAEQVTSCAFGGENLDELYVTTASCGLGDKKAAQPDAGKLFVVPREVHGTVGVRSALFGTPSTA
eukprot:NODE_2607_length_1027_cov_32.075556_g2588_i0.p1 GENE.NODE_2607_length_1027_cov_32.075556_g2588_i0~~NODE_2607_length_1027_cov_32.075556_g2588_i0.p1  ORF type:complete len:327 (-),score=42.44 NODE_2607_length_1027_cov_32.075556_g2588_i0:47-964(-)